MNNREITLKPADGNIEVTNAALHLNRYVANHVALATGGGNVGIGSALPTSKLHVSGGVTFLDGPDNNGITGTLKLRSGDDNMLLDGNEIDAIGTNNNKLFLNQNVANDVVIAGGGGNVLMSGLGNVGIGTASPTSKLHVSGQTILGGPENDGASISTLILQTGTNKMLLDGNEIDATGTGNTTLHLNQNVASDIALAGGGGDVFMIGGGNMIVNGGGSVAIGTNTTPGGYRLAVDGKIVAEELKVQNSTNWPDYVFDEDYELPTLSQLEQSIQQNGHLPGMPSAAEVQANDGVEVGDMQRRLLEKVEEMTLFIVQLEKRVKELEGKE